MTKRTMHLCLLLMAIASAMARADECRDAALAVSPAAETLCSDAIARLSYEGGDAASNPQAVAANRQALAAAFNNRAMARIAAGNPAGAAEDLGEAMSLAPENWAIYLNRGNLHLSENQPQAALSDYARARSLSPAAAAAVMKNSVLAYRALGDPGRATASLLEAESLSLSPADRTAGEPGRPRR